MEVTHEKHRQDGEEENEMMHNDNSNDNNNSNNTTSKPSSVLQNPLVLSILITETAERVAYFGFRAILVFYFKEQLKFSDSASISLFAATTALAYLSPLLGAVMADSIWGRFQTIWKFGIMYGIGLWLLTLSSYSVQAKDDDLGAEFLILERCFTFLGLLLICTGTGGIKPCVSAFGADQVVLEDENTTNIPSNRRNGNGEGDGDGIELPNRNNLQSKKSLQSNSTNNHYDNHHSNISDDDGDSGSTGKSSSSNENDKNQKQEEDEKEQRVREFFNSFYFCINLGCLVSYAVIPLIRARFGFGAAFLLPTIFMMLALFIFRSHKHKYKHRIRDETQPTLLEILLLSMSILRERFLQNTKMGQFLQRRYQHVEVASNEEDTPTFGDDGHFNDEYEEDLGESERISTSTSRSMFDAKQQVHHDASKALHVLPILMFFPVFWTLHNQQGSVWVLQATRLDLHGLEPEQLLVLNPLEIMIFIPLFDRIIYPYLDRRGYNIKPVRRMEYGMFFTGISFFVSAYLERQIQIHPPNTVSVAWQAPQITLLTIGEIFLSVTGLEFAYSQAPPNMQALLLAFYLLTITMGDLLCAALYASVFASMDPILSMTVCAVCMLINLFFFTLVVGKWKPYGEDRRQGDDHDDREG